MGTYVAPSLTATTAEDTDDLLGNGWDISLVLNAGHTTSGTLSVAAAAGESLDLTGRSSFGLDPPEVRLEHAADTFLRNIRFAVGRYGTVIELIGGRASSGTLVRVLLART